MPGANAYGTVLWNGHSGVGVQQAHVLVAHDSIAFGSVVGVEGFVKNAYSPIVDIFYKPQETVFSTSRPMISILVDDNTGAILFIGGHL